jgi:hypothetical protein
MKPPVKLICAIQMLKRGDGRDCNSLVKHMLNMQKFFNTKKWE